MSGKDINRAYFQMDGALSDIIGRMTDGINGKFKRRDFVAPLINFCSDNCYNGKIGIVYGLRSTGKTVGMLQAAEALTERGHKVAYARFNYAETGMNAVTDEIKTLAENGYTHFFLDEASYLNGFINLAADWSDWLTPRQGVKIVVSGTDSFMLWTAQRTSLFHRYEQFSSNWLNYAEYERIIGKSFDDFKRNGGIFDAPEIPAFIQSAVVDNLLHTIEHCIDDANRTNAYTDKLHGIDAAVIYKAIISILKCAAEESITAHFIEKAGEKNIPDLGAAVSGLSKADKRDIKERVADAVEIYRNFTKVDNPLDTIEALTEFLVKICCLIECSAAMTDNGKANKTYAFSHNALMSYAIEETIQSILNLKDINQPKFAESIRQAAEGALNESVVFTHILLSAGSDDKVFKYRDFEEREIDIAVINRKTKTLRLIDVKSKADISGQSAFINEAKHLYDEAILQNIGIDETFKITRAVAYMGKNMVLPRREGELLLINIEDLLRNCADIDRFFDKIADSINQSRKKQNKKSSVLERLEDAKIEAERHNQAIINGGAPFKRKTKDNRDDI